MVNIKIWTKKELRKGYIPSDKVTFRGVRFESYGLSNFDERYLETEKIKRMMANFRAENSIKELIEYVKFTITQSFKFYEMQKEDYHTHIYLNINNDGVDCFISR